jgi:hypothetical protein
MDGLSAPESLWAQSRRWDKPASGLPVNAHIHLPPNFSAFSSVTQAVTLAADQGIAALGASNYYDYTVYREFATQARAVGVFPLFGLEIITLDAELTTAGIKVNDPGNPGRMYVCGKGITAFDPLNPVATDLLEVIRTRDSQRMAQMTEQLSVVFADAGFPTGLTADSVRAHIAVRYDCDAATVFLQERHLAQAFQEAVFAGIPASERPNFWSRVFGTPSKAATDNAVALQNEIRSHLMKAGKPAYIPETFVDFDHANRLIGELGGILCYPTLLDGANPICPFEAPVADFIARLRGRGFTCAEFIPLRNRPEVLTEYVLAMRQAGLVVTAGTEHNTPELLPLAPTCLNNAPIPDVVADIFREGAFVIAAHQYLTAQGQTGFVDRAGRPNSDFVDDRARIDAFARLGAAILAEYRSAGGGR